MQGMENFSVAYSLFQSMINKRGSYQREECLQAKRKVKELQRDFELQAKQLRYK